MNERENNGDARLLARLGELDAQAAAPTLSPELESRLLARLARNRRFSLRSPWDLLLLALLLAVLAWDIVRIVSIVME